MELHFWDSENYRSYFQAFEAGAIYSCDAPLCEDEFDRWGWEGGILCDAMQAVQAALRCVGRKGGIDAAIVRDGRVISEWHE